MKVPCRIVVACVAVAAARAGRGAAATQQEIDRGVAAGAAWMRTQQNVATGQITGFGGDYALSALAAAGVHAADVRPGAPSAQDYYAGLWAGPDHAELDGDPLRPRRRARRPAAVGVHEPRRAARRRLQPRRRPRRLVRQRRDQPQRRSPRWRSPASARRRPCSPRPTATCAASSTSTAAGASAASATDAQRAAAGSVDMTGAVLAALCETARRRTTRRPRRPVVPRGPPGPGHRRLRQRRLDRLGAVRPQRCGSTRRGALDHVRGQTPVDYLLSQQDPSGAFLFAGAPNLYSTQNAVRALAGEGFSADPPRRATAADPRFRAVPAVADGTPTPHVLAIDDGAGDVRLCSVTAPAGATLAAFLAAAQARAPALRHLVRDRGGLVTEVNGRAGAWRVRVNRTPEQPAAETRVVAFGDMVSLRWPAVAGGPRRSDPGPGRRTRRRRAAGAPGPAGPRGARGRRGASPAPCARVAASRAACRQRRDAPGWCARGRVYATGTAERLRARRALRPGRYTLRLVNGGRRRKLAVTVR